MSHTYAEWYMEKGKCLGVFCTGWHSGQAVPGVRDPRRVPRGSASLRSSPRGSQVAMPQKSVSDLFPPRTIGRQ